ncbi:MAG: succinate dehydrogenase, cytochrome b556 subunit [SAR324 cluster bacterium]|nr:succinate dehydrogenase, cytochrome b556 subunit [SAR324 cluster bacterium]
MREVAAYLRETLLPQANVGTVAWLLHRVTGVALAVYLLPHFITINNARGGAAALDEALGWYTGPLVAAAEWLIVMAAVFHAFNGLRIIAVDFFDLSHRHRLLFALVLGATVAVLLASSFLFVPRLLAPA